MALRAFRSNPSLGGFGGESRLPFTSTQYGDATASLAAHDATVTPISSGSCGDAFAQIVKELVDNAVDACAPCNADVKSNRPNDRCNVENVERTRINHVYKRVRVKIESTKFQPTNNSSDGNMDCLRITVSDNGVGMRDIDACVMAFSSNKNNMSIEETINGQSSSKTAGEKSDKNNGTSSNNVKRKAKKHDKSSPSNTTAANDGYTSGRYGIGLTLCLLHAQRLVPGSVTCITSATATSKYWIRCTYQVDMDADIVRCKRREEIVKDDSNDCGTIVSLLVPGGRDAQNAWPRLAEYFARFQLSLDLSCSLEVLAPSLSRRPLMIRPPAEMELRSRVVNEVYDETKNGGIEEEREHNLDWDGDDGFVDNDDENTTLRNKDNSNLQILPNIMPDIISKATKEREHLKQETHKRTALICKAAEIYMGRTLCAKNVAYKTHPIRRINGNGSQSNRHKNHSFLEVGIFVFGPEPDDVSSDGETADSNQSKTNRSSTLQLVRMVNGIPLLDSPEAVACGVVQMVANNGANWNSFGLEVSLKKMNESASKRSGGDNDTPMFHIVDSAQVAPFFRESAHGLFYGKNRQDDDDDDDDDDEGSSSVEYIFDPGHSTRKRKKERMSLDALLPASLRLGEMLMIVNIRAKPSALPLPTLSKGRLPLNDKAIDDALENGITSCLRSLQRSNPKLLLTAHQLKRVERDLKYVPSVAGAIASVLCRSKQQGLYEHAATVVSGWDEEVKKLGIPPFNQVIEGDQRTKRRDAHEATNPRELAHEIELCRVEALRPILERRLRFIVSEEFKDSKKEKMRKEREEEAAMRKEEKTRQTRKQRRSDEADDMKSDCFGSDDSIISRTFGVPVDIVKPSHSDFESETSSPEIACIHHAKHMNLSDTSDEASHESGPKKRKSTTVTTRSPANFSSNDGFDTDDNSKTATRHAAAAQEGNDISSEDDWSTEYGMVVPGSFFR
eukprot:CCRYP_011939-RA/>CCRYP_011939-RA protein AED:0.03 eAED:0.03 QI:0/0/0/1/1/1/3/0/958